MKVFIIHYKKLVERKKFLSDFLKDFEYEFIDDFERESYNMSGYLYDENLYKVRIKEFSSERFNPVFERMKDSEICNYLSHMKVYQKIVNDNLPFGLVLEDDVVPIDNFGKELNSIIDNVPDDFDLIFLSDSYTMIQLDYLLKSESNIISNNIYKKVPGISRTVSSYIISKKACEVLLKEIKTISMPIDHELNYFMKVLKMNVYWVEPGIVCEGSKLGKYKSSIR